MKVNVYSVYYKDGKIITHYIIEELLNMINNYNKIMYPKAKMSIYKLRRYLLGKSNIPYPYISIQKMTMNELIGVAKLATINYGSEFIKMNDYANRELKCYSLGSV